MRILFVHNDYYKPSGEEHSVSRLVAILRERGHVVNLYKRSSVELDEEKFGLVRAAINGIYSRSSVQDISTIVREFRPDVVQVQNVYPLISPAILSKLRRMGVPVVMRCPNYRLFCPTGLFLDKDGQICELCTSGAKELWCIKKNCAGSVFKSSAYALRNGAARVNKSFIDNVNVFIVQSEFQKSKFVQNGIPSDQLEILPGVLPPINFKTTPDHTEGVCFIGRVSYEKGIGDFVAAARCLPKIKFTVAGGLADESGIKDSPSNVIWRGFLGEEELDEVIRAARIVVVPSRCYEGFPNVVLRAMLHGKPVVCSGIGVLKDIVENRVTGLHFDVGSVSDLVNKVSCLYQDVGRCSAMGLAAKDVVERRYNAGFIYDRLLSIYEKAIRES